MYQRLIHNLTTISLIPRGGRISTSKEFIVIEEDAMLQGWWRRVNAESRTRAVDVVVRDVTTATTIVDLMCEIVLCNSPRKNEYMKLLSKFADVMAAAVHGIVNLCATYAADADVSGHLAPMITDLNRCSAAARETIVRATAPPG